jgi:hypothetical protein
VFLKPEPVVNYHELVRLESEQEEPMVKFESGELV